MRKLLSILIVGSMMLGGVVCAVEMAPANDAKLGLAQPSEWAIFVQQWVGKDPVPSATKPKFWDSPEVKAALMKSLGEARFQQLITGWGVDYPQVSLIENVDNKLAFSACKPKSGCDPEAILFVESHNNVVEAQACWQNTWLAADGSEHKLNVQNCHYREKTDLAQMYQAHQLTTPASP